MCAAAVLLAAAACSSGGRGEATRSDSAHLEADVNASRDTGAMQGAGSTTAAPTDSARGAAAARPAAGARQDTVKKSTPAARGGTTAPPRGTSAAPGVQPPAAGAGKLAYVVFRDTVLDSDVAWLRGAGFAVEQVNAAAHSVSGRLPSGVRLDPKSNPRVLRFTVAMR